MFVPISYIRCMELGLYKNQLICIVNNVATFTWSLKELDNFEFIQPANELGLEYFEHDSWFN